MSFIIGKPFKGTFYHEWQVGPLVFQYQHTPTAYMRRAASTRSNKLAQISRFQVWCDSAWRDHMLVAPLWLRRIKRRMK